MLPRRQSIILGGVECVFRPAVWCLVYEEYDMMVQFQLRGLITEQLSPSEHWSSPSENCQSCETLFTLIVVIRKQFLVQPFQYYYQWHCNIPTSTYERPIGSVCRAHE